MSDAFSYQVLRYHKAGKNERWIAHRLGCGVSAVRGVIEIKDEVQKNLDKEKQNKDSQEDHIFEETPPTSKDGIEQALIVASSLLSESSKNILSVVYALNEVQPTEEELLDYILKKTTNVPTQSGNPYEYLVDCLLSDYILVKIK